MHTVITLPDLRSARLSFTGTVGLVPTMGYLHEGHLSLIQRARDECDHVVVSIFVNPTQFGPKEDLAKYPRDLDRDRKLIEPYTDLLWIPTPEIMYPDGYQTWVEVETMTRPLEGAMRPGHFHGVTTVVAKLFNGVQPDKAYFGQKDAQQAAVVKQLVRDLNLGLEVRVVPTVRDEDGLALSSRNAYLSPDEREAALALPRALGTKDLSRARKVLADLDVDYVEEANFNGQRVLAAAVRVGKTRLIDNVVLEGDTK